MNRSRARLFQTFLPTFDALPHILNGFTARSQGLNSPKAATRCHANKSGMSYSSMDDVLSWSPYSATYGLGVSICDLPRCAIQQSMPFIHQSGRNAGEELTPRLPTDRRMPELGSNTPRLGSSIHLGQVFVIAELPLRLATVARTPTGADLLGPPAAFSLRDHAKRGVSSLSRTFVEAA